MLFKLRAGLLAVAMVAGVTLPVPAWAGPFGLLPGDKLVNIEIDGLQSNGDEVTYTYDGLDGVIVGDGLRTNFDGYDFHEGEREERAGQPGFSALDIRRGRGAALGQRIRCSQLHGRVQQGREREFAADSPCTVRPRAPPLPHTQRGRERGTGQLRRCLRCPCCPSRLASLIQGSRSSIS